MPYNTPHFLQCTYTEVAEWFGKFFNSVLIDEDISEVPDHPLRSLQCLSDIANKGICI